MSERSRLKFLGDEQLDFDFGVNRLGNLVARRAVLFDEETALVGLSKTPDVENGEGVEQLAQLGAKV